MVCRNVFAHTGSHDIRKQKEKYGTPESWKMMIPALPPLSLPCVNMCLFSANKGDAPSFPA